MRKFTLIAAALVSLFVMPALADGPYVGVIHEMYEDDYSVTSLPGAEHEMSYPECSMRRTAWNDVMAETIEKKFKLLGTHGSAEAGCKSITPVAPHQDLYIPTFRRITTLGEYQEYFLPGLEPGTSGIDYFECQARLKAWGMKLGVKEKEKYSIFWNSVDDKGNEAELKCELPNRFNETYIPSVISISVKNGFTDFRNNPLIDTDIGVSYGECLNLVLKWDPEHTKHETEKNLEKQGEYFRINARCLEQY